MEIIDKVYNSVYNTATPLMPTSINLDSIISISLVVAGIAVAVIAVLSFIFVKTNKNNETDNEKNVGEEAVDDMWRDLINDPAYSSLVGNIYHDRNDD